LITGSARSGTLHMATMLRAAGVNAGHERAVSVRAWRELRPGEVEASWLAAPLGLSAHTVHQVRHPLATVSSLLHRGAFAPHNVRSRWGRYAARFLPGLLEEPTVIERVCRYYIEWNALVRADTRWRIEDVTDARVAEAVGLAADQVAAGRAMLPGAMHQSLATSLGWEDIPARFRDELRRLTVEFGYDEELPRAVDRPRSEAEVAASDYLAWLHHIDPAEFRRWPEPAAFVRPEFTPQDLSRPRFRDPDLSHQWLFLERAERDGMLQTRAVARRRKSLHMWASARARAAGRTGEAVSHLREAFRHAGPAGARERLAAVAVRNEVIGRAAMLGLRALRPRAGAPGDP
jgi:hypothetical protein